MMFWRIVFVNLCVVWSVRVDKYSWPSVWPPERTGGSSQGRRMLKEIMDDKRRGSGSALCVCVNLLSSRLRQQSLHMEQAHGSSLKHATDWCWGYLRGHPRRLGTTAGPLLPFFNIQIAFFVLEDLRLIAHTIWCCLFKALSVFFLSSSCFDSG